MFRRATVLVAAAMMLGLLLPAAPVVAQGPTVSVLVDFGDGTYLWADVTLPPSNVSALRALELANASWGLVPLEVQWVDETFCVRRPCASVEDIGNRDPAGWPGAWWHFYGWDPSDSRWETSLLGPSDLDVQDGWSLAWYLAVDDPDTGASPAPAPRPDFRDVWTSFRGDLQNRGLSRGSVPVTNARLWERDVGVLEIGTTPVVAYGKVFVATRNALVALDAETGDQAWRNPQVRSLLSTPSVYDGALILGGTDGRLRSVDAATGAERWSVLLEPGAVSTGIASSPALHEGRAYIGTFNESAGGSGKVVAVNLNNGTIAWSVPTGSIHMSAPAIAGRALYVGVMGVYDGDVGYGPPHGLLSLWLNGSANWFYAADGPVASSPVVAEGHVAFTAKDGFLYALAADGTLAWKRSVGPGTSGPAFVASTLYAASGGLDGQGALYAFDLAGGLQWQAPTGGALQASLVSDGRLVCAATNVAVGRHVCHRTADGGLAWDHTPVPNQYILGSPVVVGDTLYAVSDNGRVYAFWDGDPASFPLLRLTLRVPQAVEQGAPTSFSIAYAATGRGLAADVRLRAFLPAGLRLANETEVEGAVPRVLTMELGDLAPGTNATRTFNATVLPGFVALPIEASLAYSDLAGRPYPDLHESALIQASAPGLQVPPILLWTFVAVLGVAVLAAVALAFRRRRRGEPRA